VAAGTLTLPGTRRGRQVAARIQHAMELRPPSAFTVTVSRRRMAAFTAAETTNRPLGPGRAAPRTEGGRRIAARRAGFERTAFGFQFVEAAVENAASSKPSRAQHPPEARRPHHRADAVEHTRVPGPIYVPAERRTYNRADRRHNGMRCGGYRENSPWQVEKSAEGTVASYDVCGRARRCRAGRGPAGAGSSQVVQSKTRQDGSPSG